MAIVGAGSDPYTRPDHTEKRLIPALEGLYGHWPAGGRGFTDRTMYVLGVGMPDPHEPGWRSKYTGDDSLGDVGTDFAVELEELYKAGRWLFPGTALEYSVLTARLHRLGPTMQWVLASGRTPEPAHALLLELRETLQDALRKSSIHIDAAAAALREIADAYARTDEATADDLARAMDGDARYDQSGVPYVPPPPAPGDPQPVAEPDRFGEIPRGR